MAPDQLPTIFITAHTAEEYQHAQAAAERFRPLAQAIEIQMQRGRNETALHALQVHPARELELAQSERKSQMLLLDLHGGGGKPQFIASFVGSAGTTCDAWPLVIAYKRGKPTAYSLAGFEPGGASVEAASGSWSKCEVSTGRKTLWSYKPVFLENRLQVGCNQVNLQAILLFAEDGAVGCLRLLYR